MKLKPLICAALLACAAAGASAEDFTQDIAFVANAGQAGAGSAAWGVTHVEAGAFTDTFTFTGLTDGYFSGSLVTIGFMDSENIDFTSVSVNGQSYNLIGSGTGVEVATFAMQALTGPLVLSVSGIAGPALTAGSVLAASYAGTANLAPVPELQTTAMMLAGLGVIGLLGRRRFMR